MAVIQSSLPLRKEQAVHVQDFRPGGFGRSLIHQLCAADARSFRAPKPDPAMAFLQPAAPATDVKPSTGAGELAEEIVSGDLCADYISTAPARRFQTIPLRYPRVVDREPAFSSKSGAGFIYRGQTRCLVHQTIPPWAIAMSVAKLGESRQYRSLIKGSQPRRPICGSTFILNQRSQAGAL